MLEFRSLVYWVWYYTYVVHHYLFIVVCVLYVTMPCRVELCNCISQTELAQLGSYLYLKGIRFALAPSKLPNLYSDPASAQVVIGALKVTKVSLFTVIPLLGFPKYRYLQ